MEWKFSVDCLNKNFGQNFTGKFLTHIGTPLYQAPEISGLGSYTEAVDIWGIGIIMAFGLFSEEIQAWMAEECKQGSGNSSENGKNWDELIETINDCIENNQSVSSESK